VRSLADSLRYAMMQQETGEVPLCLLTITHPSLVEPIRLVNDAVSEDGTTNIVKGGETFVAFPFDIILPSDLDKQPPRARLTVSNVSQEIVSIVLLPFPAPEVKIEIIRAGAPDEEGAVWDGLKFGEPEFDDMWVTTDLVSDDESLMPACYRRYDAVHCPALFRAAA